MPTRLGLAVAEVCRKHGISAATYYAWKSKYAGASVSDLRTHKLVAAHDAAIEGADRRK